MNDHQFAQILARQFDAALAMMQNAIDKCPDEVWQRRGEREAPFWQHALHVLFYTRLYAFDSLECAKASGNAKHVMALIGAPLRGDSEAELNRIGSTLGYSGLTEAAFTTPRTPTRAEALDYLEMTRATVNRALEGLAEQGGADGPNPMPWMRGTRGESMLYNLRHVHQHLGRLHSMLGRAGVKVDWIGGLPQA
jgi:hypothetical protein